MNEHLSRLLDQFRAAEAAVDASRATLRKASAERLAKLLQRPARERLQALGEADLTAFDREQLERSLEGQLPKPRPRFVRTMSVPRLIWRFVRYHRRGCLRGALVIAPFAWFGIQAVMATPTQTVPVQLNVPFTVRWAMPGGYYQEEDLAAGSDEIWVLINGQGHFRKWFNGQGYGLSGPIPDSYLTDQLIVRRKI